MDGAARNLVEALIDRFIGTLAPDLATLQKQRVIEQETRPLPLRLGGSTCRWARRITSACMGQ